MLMSISISDIYATTRLTESASHEAVGSVSLNGNGHNGGNGLIGGVLINTSLTSGCGTVNGNSTSSNHHHHHNHHRHLHRIDALTTAITHTASSASAANAIAAASLSAHSLDSGAGGNGVGGGGGGGGGGGSVGGGGSNGSGSNANNGSNNNIEPPKHRQGLLMFS